VDTNVLLRGFRDENSAAGRLLEAILNRRVLILLSKPVMAEYRSVLREMAESTRFPALTPQAVGMTLDRLQFFSDYVRNPASHFEYDRDPRDEKFIELAIAGNATHIVSFDNDLLSLTSGHGDAANRFRQRLPAVKVVRPREFMDRHARDIGGE